MRRFVCIATLLIVSLVAAGCATTKGKISNGNYDSPMGNFSLSLPNFAGLKVQDEKDEYGGRVSMHGSFGGQQAVTYLRLPESVNFLHQDSAEKDAAYRSFVTDVMMPELFVRASPQAKIIHEEYLYKDDKRAYFAVVNIPEGSVLVDMKNNKRLDSVRGLLVFSKNGFMYMLESEMNSILSPINPSNLSRKEIEFSQASLNEIRNSITFK